MSKSDFQSLDVSVLKRRIPIYDLAVRLSHHVPGCRDRIICPVCDAHAHLQRDGLGYRCRACGESGDHITLIQEVQRCNFLSAQARLSEHVETYLAEQGGVKQGSLI